jgi:hypothetical protein
MPPVDDPTIGDNVLLWRRLAPSHYIVDANGQRIISSAAFNDEELSAFIAAQTTHEAVLKGYPQHGLVAFTAGDARRVGGPERPSEGYILARDPPGDPCHVLLLPQVKLTKNPRKRQIRGLRDCAIVCIAPQAAP